ncbi:serine dehydrogenasease, partial [Xenorhabdus sp. XENO-7]|nr:serine dehydrogenasease [Xenorhabdus aichiensis]
LKKWLVDYKFKKWTHKETSGIEVTLTDKEERAEEIAVILSDNKRWHSHSRSIGINTIIDILKLKVEDYSNMEGLSNKIKQIHNVIIEFSIKSQREIVVISSLPIIEEDDSLDNIDS